VASDASAIVSELSRIIGAEHVVEAPLQSPYNHDSSNRRDVAGHADAVALPGSAQEVAAVVAWCYEHDVPIVPRGGGTGLVGGAVATQGGVVCSLERLRRIRELEPALWRMFPEAGVSTRDVQRLARENGLFFAPDPGAAEQSQIGGNVATNAGGPHALKYGVTGSWVAGIEAVLAPGELVHVGGWAAKDVAGYDLKSLLVGSEGTLGVITAVQLGLLPAPETAIPLVVFLATRDAGCAAICAVFAAGLRPSVLDFMDGATLAITAAAYPGDVPPQSGFALICEVDGSQAEARAQRDALVELLGEGALAVHEPPDPRALWRWRDGANPAVTGARGAKVSEDVVFPLERLAEGLERFERIASAHRLDSCAWGHGGEGNVHATVLVNPSSEAELEAAGAVGEELFAVVVELGGSIAGEHGVGWLKRGRLASQWDRRAVEAHEQIKRAFDPKGLLNPGKKLAR
jgi:glycolate oxidase subunit GlcD